MSTILRIHVVSISLLFALVSENATADLTSSSSSSSSELKRMGDAFMDRRQYIEALAAYQRSYAADPDPALLYNAGRASQYLGDYPQALRYFRKFLSDAPSPLRSKVAQLPELVSELEGKVGTVRLECDVSDTILYFDGQRSITCQAGQTHVLELNAGTTTMSIVTSGNFIEHRSVQILPRGLVALPIRPTSPSPKARLVVRSTAPQSHVSVDGKSEGVAPTTTCVSEGIHEVIVTASGHRPVRAHVSVGDGREVVFRASPQPDRSLLKSWWVWAGVGMIASAIAIGAIAATTEAAPPSGTFSPGQIRFLVSSPNQEN